jgi:hypothetical protein
VYVPVQKFRKGVGGSSKTEGRHGALGLGVDGQVMICPCGSSSGLSTSFYGEAIGRNANEIKRILCRGCPLPDVTIIRYIRVKKLSKGRRPDVYEFIWIPFSL